MTYLITRSDGSFLLELDNNSIVNDKTSLTLIGENVKSYGSYVNQNFVNLTDNFANSESPAIPIVGQIWYDRANHLVRVFNGQLWDTVSSPFNGNTGVIKFNLLSGSSPIKVILSVVASQIHSVYSQYAIAFDDLPESIQYNNKSYVFKQLFPNGIDYGVTLGALSNVTLEYNGNAYSTTKLRVPATIGLSGDFNGNVEFSGNANVVINSSFSNLYVGNSNVTINGVYSNVTVDNTGRIVNLGNISYNDVISALGYIPYSSANAAVDNVPNTLVIRDQFGNFSTNLVSATTTYTTKFVNNVTVNLTGGVEGASIGFNGSSNIVIDSYRTMPGNIAAGVYNNVTVNSAGVVETASLIEKMPVGSIVLYNNSVVIPEGWALCNGGNIITPDGQTVTTPNLVNVAIGGTTYIMKVFRNVYLPSNDTIVGTLSVNLVGGGVPTITFVGGPDIKYPPLVFSNVNVSTTTANVNTYTKIKRSFIPDGFKGSRNTPSASATNGFDYKVNDVLYFDFPDFNQKASARVTEIGANGGITKVELQNEGRYKPFVNNALGLKPESLKKVKPSGGSGTNAVFDLEIERVNQPSIVQDVDFKDNLFFDSVSIVLSGGDPNAVMLSQTNIFGDLSNLSVVQVINNLKFRQQTGLPPRLGKYMLSLDDIVNYSGVLGIPVNITNFTIALQNRLMLLKITDLSNEFSYLGYYPSDDKLFGASYIGFGQYVAILKGAKTDKVGNTLVSAGFQLTGLNTVDGLTNEVFLTYVSKTIVNAKVSIFNNRIAIQTALEINNQTKQNTIPVPAPLIGAPLLTTGNANIIISESVIDGIAVTYGGIKPDGNTAVGYGGGSFVLGGQGVNNNIYSVINESIYGNGQININGGKSSDNDYNVFDPGLDTGTGSKFKDGVSTETGTGSGYKTQGGGPVDYSNTGNSKGYGKGYTLSNAEIEGIVRHEATLRGIDPDVAVAVWSSEGKGSYQSGIVPTNPNVGTNNGFEASYGPFQLYTGGGLGNKYQTITGKDLTTDNTPLGIISQIQFALDEAATSGWGAWYGAAKVGVSNFDGLAGAKPVNNLGGQLSIEYFPIASKLISDSASDIIEKVASSDIVKGVTATASKLVNGLSPLGTVASIVESAVLPTSIIGLTGVTTAVVNAVSAGKIAVSVGTSIINSVSSVLENAGVTVPSVKAPATVGGITVSTIKSTSSSGSSGGYSLGSTSPPNNGPSVTISKPASDFSSGSGTKLSFSSSTTGGQSATAGVMTSGASLSFGSSVSSAKTSTGSTASYSLGTSVSKPSNGGVAASNTGGAYSLKGCFVFDTLVDMLDGTVKKIGELRLGDQIRGGEVLALHCYDGAPLYNYQGVHVSGTHYVFENGKPVMVKDSVNAEKIDDVYGLYTVDTSGRRIFANDIEFADHNGDGVIFDFFNNTTTTTFNSEKEIFDEVLRQVKDAKL